jgi:aspartyl-tRNA(Asn)/glutamyl-tRNA(Gln) amidotransferase subunit A
MIEFAGGLGYRSAGASITGPCRTVDPARWAGGSSSGSGSAVAAGLVGFALGTETWGSILCPSAFCGTTGLRPTYGRVSRAGAMVCSYTYDKVGPIARSARDCRLILTAIAGSDPDDPTSSEEKATCAASRCRAARGEGHARLLEGPEPERRPRRPRRQELGAIRSVMDEVTLPGSRPPRSRARSSRRRRCRP